jgi:hypothetical protein
VPPCAHKRDIRHLEEKVMSYSYELLSEIQENAEYLRDGIGSTSQIGAERTGVTHLVHKLGHPVCALYLIFISRLLTAYRLRTTR